MIAFLQGILQDIEPDAIILNVNGIGYRVMLPEKIIMSLPPRGEVMEIHTFFNLREDSASLYGFMSKDELGLFKKLLSVSGVGPKVAMNIMGATENIRFIEAILGEEMNYLTKLPGVGKKTAQRLIFELKDKLTLPEGMIVDGSMALGTKSASGQDALDALLELGYQKQEVLPFIAKGQEVLGMESAPQELIRFVLQGIAKGRRRS